MGYGRVQQSFMLPVKCLKCGILKTKVIPSLLYSYINTFLKGKQEVSGYSPNAADQQSLKKYICSNELHRGVKLDPQKSIKKAV